MNETLVSAYYSAAEHFRDAYDNQARDLLERNGIEWSDNIEEMKRRLADMGYRLEADTHREFMKSAKYTFYLLKIVDKQALTINFTLENSENA